MFEVDEDGKRTFNCSGVCGTVIAAFAFYGMFEVALHIYQWTR